MRCTGCRRRHRHVEHPAAGTTEDRGGWRGSDAVWRVRIEADQQAICAGKLARGQRCRIRASGQRLELARRSSAIEVQAPEYCLGTCVVEDADRALLAI